LVEHALSLVEPPAEITVVTFGEDNAVGHAARRLYERYGFKPAEAAPDGPDGGARQVFRLRLECRMTPERQELLAVLQETRELLSLPENDFAWSSWQDAEQALQEMDNLIARVESGEAIPQAALSLLYAPTGPIQEVSLSSRWGDQFLLLAHRLDAVIDDF
jgi:hypothetical protein